MATLHDMMAQVGHLFLEWGFLEGELHKAVERLEGQASPVVRLDHWREVHQRVSGADAAHMAKVDRLIEDLTPARRMRNALSHGMRSARADPSRDDPYVTCRTVEGDAVDYSLSSLRAEIDAMPLRRSRVEGLTTAALRLKRQA